MGLRYERDSRRATNGPMIFFSDPSAESDICNEIRGAIEANLAFYAYRRPGDLMISFGSSENLVEGLGEPGFVIAPFLPSGSLMTIPYKNRQKIKTPDFDYSFPSSSTTREEYFGEISDIQKELQKYPKGKIVAARTILGEGRIDAGATFSRLCQLYPAAFVFCFGTPVTGCWIGASPELLLEASHSQLSTMSLAGTRPIGSIGDWNQKNIEEQRIVTDYILEKFKNHGLNPSSCVPYTKAAGEIEHICTEISAPLSPTLEIVQLENLLKDLSPTPALCGYPRDIALETIRRSESFHRDFYGGFCGPFHSSSDFTFNVVLRCAFFEAERYALFAGGGITLKSEPAEEWHETEMKASTLLSSLIF